MSRGRRRLLALLIGLGLLCVVFVAANAWARSAGYGLGPVFDNLTVPDDVGWRWLPDQHVVSPNGFPLDINDCGLRDPREVRLPKPAGTWRLVALGDSFTYGLGLPFELTYSHRLETSLRERAGSGPDAESIEVWNAGVNGLNSCQELGWLRAYGLPLEPDVVTVGFVMNDVIPTTSADLPRRFPGRSWMLRLPIYHWLRINALNRWRLMGNDPEAARLKALINQHRGFAEQAPSKSAVARGYWDEALGCLSEMAAVCRERGIPLVLIVFPTLPQMNQPDPLPEPQVLLRKLAAREGLILVDLLEPYAAAGPSALFESDKSHPSELGNAIAAEELLRALDAAGVLPQAAQVPPGESR
jgi:lysophospholipase L1-like esterase